MQHGSEFHKRFTRKGTIRSLGGPPLSGEAGTPEFVASYNKAVERKRLSTGIRTTGKVLHLYTSERRA
jgi:hypothetical protein